MAKSTAVAKTKVGQQSLAQKVHQRVPLAKVDKDTLDAIVGFETHPKAKIECRMSDNLLKAAIYVLRGIKRKQEQAKEMGQEFTGPTDTEGMLAAIAGDHLVRQRMRELVTQLNVTKQPVLPVRLPQPKDGAPTPPAVGVMEYLLANLALGFGDDENRPAAMPQVTPLYLGEHQFKKTEQEGAPEPAAA